jgi:hypothetical protein
MRMIDSGTSLDDENEGLYTPARVCSGEDLGQSPRTVCGHNTPSESVTSAALECHTRLAVSRPTSAVLNISHTR